MIKNKMLCAFMVILYFAVYDFAYSHCHNDEVEEDGVKWLIYGVDENGNPKGRRRWDLPGTPELVRYYINQYDIPGVPSLRNGDVTYASARWSKIKFNNQTVPFELIYAGITTTVGGIRDRKNVVDWGWTEHPSQVALT